VTYLVRGLVDQSQNLLNLLTNPLKDSDLPGQEIGDQSQNLFNLFTTPFRDSDLSGQGTCGSEQESTKPFEQPIPLKGLSHEIDSKFFD
jgi:hypothetical protein